MAGMFERLFDDWNKRTKDWLCEVLSILKYDESYGELVMGMFTDWFLMFRQAICGVFEVFEWHWDG